MKKLKIYICLIMLFTLIAFILTFFDGGNKVIDKTYQAKVISCEEGSSAGLDTYYIVNYTYDRDGSESKGYDSYYPNKVEEGDTINIVRRETIKSKTSTYLYYASILCYTVLGLICIPMGYQIFRLLQHTNKVSR